MLAILVVCILTIWQIVHFGYSPVPDGQHCMIPPTIGSGTDGSRVKAGDLMEDDIVGACLREKYVVWQAHQSGLGSNLLIGLPYALKYAQALNRTLVFGPPPLQWLYANKLPRGVVDSAIANRWEQLAQLDFWSYYFNHPVVQNPCTPIINRLAETDITPEPALLDNSAHIITLNLDQGPKFIKFYEEGRVRGTEMAREKNPVFNMRDSYVLYADIMKNLTTNARIGFLMRAFAMSAAHGNINHFEGRAQRYVSMQIRGGDKASEIELPERGQFLDYLKWVEEKVGSPFDLFLAGDDLDACNIILKGRPYGSTFRLPLHAPNPFELSRTSSGCFHPCLINDVIFDAVMLSQAEIMFETPGSSMSALGYFLDKQTPRTLIKLGRSIEDLDREVNMTNHYGGMKEALPEGCHGMCNDPRKAWKIQFRGAIIFEHANQARIGVHLLSLHPYLFLFHPKDQALFMGGNSGWPDQVPCDLFNDHGRDIKYATPSQGANGLMGTCETRPVQLLVGLASPSLDSLCMQGTKKTCLKISGTSNLHDHQGFVDMVKNVQRQFGLPNILPESTLLYWWWNRTIHMEPW